MVRPSGWQPPGRFRAALYPCSAMRTRPDLSGPGYGGPYGPASALSSRSSFRSPGSGTYVSGSTGKGRACKGDPGHISHLVTRLSVKNTRDDPYSHRRSVTLVGVPWTARTSSLVEPTVKEAGTGLMEAAGNNCTLRGEPGQMSQPITRPALKYRRDPPYSHTRSVAQVGGPWMARTAS